MKMDLDLLLEKVNKHLGERVKRNRRVKIGNRDYLVSGYISSVKTKGLWQNELVELSTITGAKISIPTQICLDEFCARVDYIKPSHLKVSE